MKYIMMVIFLSLPVSAYADWGNPEMHTVLTPNMSPNQGHDIHINAQLPMRVEPQHRVQSPQPVEHRTQPVVNHTQAVRHDQPDYHYQATEHQVPGYFRRDVNYYGQADVVFPYADVDPGFNVPDGYESVVVNGQIYFYNDGIFYQQINDQLVAIPPVIGAVVDSIPTDYQIVMADGTHYLYTGGVFYQRVDLGFEVVAPPVTEDS